MPRQLALGALEARLNGTAAAGTASPDSVAVDLNDTAAPPPADAAV